MRAVAIAPPAASPLLSRAFVAKESRVGASEGSVISAAKAERRLDGGMHFARQCAAKDALPEAIDTLDEMHSLCMERHLSGVQRFFSAGPAKSNRQADARIGAAITSLSKAGVLLAQTDAELRQGNTGSLFSMLDAVSVAAKQMYKAADNGTLADASPAQIRALEAAMKRFDQQGTALLKDNRAADRLQKMTREYVSQHVAPVGSGIMKAQVINFDIARFGLARVISEAIDG